MIYLDGSKQGVALLVVETNSLLKKVVDMEKTHKALSLFLHETESLKPDRRVLNPFVRIHFIGDFSMYGF